MLTALPLYEANKLMALEIAINNILNTDIEHIHKAVLAKRDLYDTYEVKEVKTFLEVMNNYNRSLRILHLAAELRRKILMECPDIPKGHDKYRLEL